MKNLTAPPSSIAYYALWALKMDFEIDRNILLNFLNDAGLNEKFVNYLDTNFTDENEDD